MWLWFLAEVGFNLFLARGADDPPPWTSKAIWALAALVIVGVSILWALNRAF